MCMFEKWYSRAHVCLDSDTFNENSPPTSDPSYISSLGAAVFKAMSKADKDAVWLMQVCFLFLPLSPPLVLLLLQLSLPTFYWGQNGSLSSFSIYLYSFCIFGLMYSQGAKVRYHIRIQKQKLMVANQMNCFALLIESWVRNYPLKSIKENYEIKWTLFVA